ncbi:MAG: DICT sensory domain-containing protein [Nitriliruptoraceae bacterium]
MMARQGASRDGRLTAPEGQQVDEHGRGTATDDARPVLRSFLEAVGDRAVPTTVSKPALIELSHALEDLVVDGDLAGTVIAGFQRSRFWATERTRYEALAADPRRRAIVFTADEGDGAPGVQHLTVGPDHPVAREWFVITLTSSFSAVLFGRELSRPEDWEQARRRFVTVWSFDRSVVDDLLAVLSEALADSVPGATAALATARAAHPPRSPATGSTQRFANAFVERLELATQRTRSLRAELNDARRLLAELEPDMERSCQDRPSERPEASAPGPVPSAAAPGQLHDADAADPPDQLHDADGPAQLHDADGPSDDSAAGPPPRHALVLHCDPGLRGLIEALLRRSGWQVTAVASLEQGLDAATMNTFDAILVDTRAIDGDETTLLDELERVQPGAHAQTAFVTDEATSVGAHHGRPTVTTPLVWSELEAVLRALTTTL